MDAITEKLLNDARESGLVDEGKADYGDAYGIGKWQDAVLLDVLTHEATQYGYRLGLKINLKGDSMPYTGRIDLPTTVETNGDEGRNAWLVKQNDAKRDVLNRLLAATGYTVVVKGNIENDAQYEQLVGLFRAKVGEAIPVVVKADGKNVKDADGKWTFEPNGFSKLDGMRPKRKK